MTEWAPICIQRDCRFASAVKARPAKNFEIRLTQSTLLRTRSDFVGCGTTKVSVCVCALCLVCVCVCLGADFLHSMHRAYYRKFIMTIIIIITYSVHVCACAT